MWRRLRELWQLPKDIAARHDRVERDFSTLTQAVRDLDATIKTHWAVAERPAAPPRRLGHERDPHGL